jgi:hypothetical protein
MGSDPGSQLQSSSGTARGADPGAAQGVFVREQQQRDDFFATGDEDER